MEAVWHSASPQDTERLGTCLGELLESGDVLALSGDLGGGKTTLTRGIAGGLGVPESCAIQSPTFTLIHEYPGRVPLHHVDLYRVERPLEAEDLGLEELLFAEGVTVVEWAEKLAQEYLEEALLIELEYQGENERRITMRAQGDRARRLLEELVQRGFGVSSRGA